MKTEKYIIKANQKELDDIGISYDINGLPARLIRDYQTGWLCLEVKHRINHIDFVNEFDLPKYMLIPV